MSPDSPRAARIDDKKATSLSSRRAVLNTLRSRESVDAPTQAAIAAPNTITAINAAMLGENTSEPGLTLLKDLARANTSTPGTGSAANRVAISPPPVHEQNTAVSVTAATVHAAFDQPSLEAS